jgi:hypothetical protein
MKAMYLSEVQPGEVFYLSGDTAQEKYVRLSTVLEGYIGACGLNSFIIRLFNPSYHVHVVGRASVEVEDYNGH